MVSYVIFDMHYNVHRTVYSFEIDIYVILLICMKTISWMTCRGLKIWISVCDRHLRRTVTIKGKYGTSESLGDKTNSACAPSRSEHSLSLLHILSNYGLSCVCSTCSTKEISNWAVVGVAKPPFVDFSVIGIDDVTNLYVKFFKSVSTSVDTAQLRGLLSNVNVIFSMWPVFLRRNGKNNYTEEIG